MEYNYELLRKCHGLRFRATIADKPQEGIIKVTSEGVMLCYGEEDPGYLRTFGRRDTLSFSEQTFPILPSDFEIVPRDPETYTDWQVGDVIRYYGNNEIIFRSGEVVVFKYSNNKASSIYTCSELFEVGYRLVLTDIEQQIIEERKRQERTPQDGDICYAETKSGEQKFIIIYNHRDWSLAYGVCSDKWRLEEGNSWVYSTIRSATEDEKQQLFDALAKEGKRWNAETKVVEDIEPEDNEAADVQKMISDALKGYIPEGDIEGFPVEVIAKMLERQYEQTGKVDVKVFEKFLPSSKEDGGFSWKCTPEGFDFWKEVLTFEDFSAFFRLYPREDKRQFRKFDPVLVRDESGKEWRIAAFVRLSGDSDYLYVVKYESECLGYRYCIPYNERTMHLLGTTEDYQEEQS